MKSVFNQAQWPSAAADDQGGLWIAYRTFPTEESAEPPTFELRLANSWQGLQPTTVARDPHLSPPALAMGGQKGRQQGVLAWTVGPGGHGGIQALTVDREGLGVPVVLPHAYESAGIIGLTATADGAGRFWLAWLEVTGRASVIYVCCRDDNGWHTPEPVTDPHVAASVPVLAPDPTGGLWIAWSQTQGRDFVPMARHRSQDGVWQTPIAATSDPHQDLDVDIAVDAQGRLLMVWKRCERRWGTIPGFRLNEETHLYARAYDPAQSRWVDLAPQAGQPLPIAAAVRYMPIAGNETLEHWAGPLSPRIFVDKAGVVHVLFRRYRDVHGVYDWGFDLQHIAWDQHGWGSVAPMGHTAGHPDAQVVPLRMADGGAALVYQFTNFGPIYRHCVGGDERPEVSLQHSGIAAIRLPWGSLVPPLGRTDLADPQALAAGTADLRAAHEIIQPTPVGPAVMSTSTRSELRSLSGQERCFFGDLHNHSDVSNCMPNKDGSVWEHLRWARDVAGLDFYAMTDHLEDSYPVAFDQLVQAADVYDQPGSFAALYGTEFTNVMAEDGKPSIQDICLFMRDRLTAWRVWQRLRPGPGGDDFILALRHPALRNRVFLARHFHGGNGGGTDLNEACNRLLAPVGPDLEPVVEMVQFRGAVPAIVNGLLFSGQRKGIIGGSDHGRPRSVFARGVTGIWAAELSRDALMDALFQRRTFATNGPLMAADFSVAAAAMGQEAASGGAVELAGFVQGTTALKRVAVYRDGELWRQVDGQGAMAQIRFADNLDAGSHFYWIHAVQEPDSEDSVDGELWTSAAWVSVEG